MDPDDPIRVTGTGTRARLSGTLLHDLPSQLKNVRLIWITNQRINARRYTTDGRGGELPWIRPAGSGDMPNLGHYWATGEDWSANKPFDLESFLPTGNTFLHDSIYKRYIKGEERSRRAPVMGAGRSLTDPQIRNYFEMLSMYHQLTPPKYRRVANKDPDTVVISRKLGRELDLSSWFNRPCLILMGYLEDSATPIPLQVDGTTPRSNGLTIVRWIYPLPVDEDRIPTPAGRRTRFR